MAFWNGKTHDSILRVSSLGVNEIDDFLGENTTTVADFGGSDAAVIVVVVVGVLTR